MGTLHIGTVHTAQLQNQIVFQVLRQVRNKTRKTLWNSLL